MKTMDERDYAEEEYNAHILDDETDGINSGDQVRFKALNEYLIGEAVFKWPGTSMWDVKEGGIIWLIEEKYMEKLD